MKFIQSRVDAHDYDFSAMAGEQNVDFEQAQLASEAAFSCSGTVGTAGTAGTMGGCFGSVGTAGSFGCGSNPPPKMN